MKTFQIDSEQFGPTFQHTPPVRSMELEMVHSTSQSGILGCSLLLRIPPNPATPAGPELEKTYLLSLPAAAHLEKLLRQALREALYGSKEQGEDQLF